jgi:UDPglucose 6-dehydrogenase
MQVTVIGAGHVGLVTAVCLAAVGHDVVADEDDQAKLDLLRQGRAWFYEPELQDLMTRAMAAGRLRFTRDKAEAVRHGQVIFVSVGTPSRPDGSPNLRFVEAVARDVARHLPTGDFRLICEKSTVPVQTGDRVAQVLRREAQPGAEYEVASNPEFLREGSAVRDTLYPDRIVVGTESPRGAALLRELYAPILEQAGFEVSFMLLFDRPTPLDDCPDGAADWVRMFGGDFLQAVPPARRDRVLGRINELTRPALYRDGKWVADYRRLRFVAVKREPSTPA